MPAAAQTYLWTPGQGPDAEALKRLRERAPPPKEPMGEAWFMGSEREMYTGLMQSDPQDWPSHELRDALEALTTGPKAFGHIDEWSEWFEFLLPRVLERADDRDVYELLVSAVFVHCLDPALPEFPPRFRMDLLDTLGRRLMAPSCWSDGHAGGSDGLLQPLSNTYYGLEAHGAFSAACCLVLRYLDAEAVDGWLASVLAIDDTAWRCVFVVWLAGAGTLVLDAGQPDRLENPQHLDIDWNWSFLHDGSDPSRKLEPDAPQFAFFPEPQAQAMRTALKRRLDLATMVRWGEQLTALPLADVDRITTLWQYDAAVLHVVERYGLS